MTDAIFSLLLLLITTISLILGLYHYFLKPKEANPTTTPHKKQDTWFETIRTMFPVFLTVLILRSFFFAPFKIPSGSMIPTLEIGDYILVNKWAYDLRFPYFNFKILNTQKPQRGDVAVFSSTQNFSKQNEGIQEDMIKRVIGLPGDTITYENKSLYINQQLITKHLNYEGIDTEYEPALQGTFPYIIETETIDEKTFQVKNYPIIKSVVGKWTVPEGMYFMMGDNRDLSDDSRYWGFVPESHLIGKASYIWMHWPKFFTTWPTFSKNRTIK